MYISTWVSLCGCKGQSWDVIYVDYIWDSLFEESFKIWICDWFEFFVDVEFKVVTCVRLLNNKKVLKKHFFACEKVVEFALRREWILGGNVNFYLIFFSFFHVCLA